MPGNADNQFNNVFMGYAERKNSLAPRQKR
jgi:hypothetical protein